MSLKGKIAIITGAAQGIGFACAERFVNEGAIVVIADNNNSKGKLAQECLANRLGKAEFICCDVSQKKEVQSLVDVVVSRFGSLDIMISNAAILQIGGIIDLEEADFNRVLDINLKGVFFCGQSAARQMIKQGKGCIINMSSIQAIITNPNILSYAVCKGGVKQLTVSMALALADKGIRVNAIGPGSIATEMVLQVTKDPKVKQNMLSRTPLGRMGQPSEIASIAVFLASEESSYITGTTINADGGRLGLNYTVPVSD
jgi:NAD(P)-dependent dehydrogenase (short-subunit alcohol dehydrogenase family)